MPDVTLHPFGVPKVYPCGGYLFSIGSFIPLWQVFGALGLVVVVVVCACHWMFFPGKRFHNVWGLPAFLIVYLCTLRFFSLHFSFTQNKSLYSIHDYASTFEFLHILRKKQAISLAKSPSAPHKINSDSMVKQPCSLQLAAWLPKPTLQAQSNGRASETTLWLRSYFSLQE